LFLIYNHIKSGAPTTLRAQVLSSDGLSTANDQNQYTDFGEWGIWTTHHFKHGNMDYVFYSARYGLQIARSANGILGPYEAMIGMVLNGDYQDVSIVKDVNGDDVVIFSNSDVYAAPLQWSQDGWPIITNFFAKKHL